MTSEKATVNAFFQFALPIMFCGSVKYCKSD